jgi:hypothetical protein
MIKIDDINNLLTGLAILGTGGGGAPEWGQLILENDINKGRSVSVVMPSDVPDDALVLSGGIMGSVKVLDQIKPNDLIQKWEKDFLLLRAFELMEELLNRKATHLVAFEMGGLNTPIILSLGARMGLPVVNGDGLGRAAPETQMVSFIGHGISLTPMTLVDGAGNEIIVNKGAESTFPDQVGRWLISLGSGLGGNCHYPMSGKELKKSVIPGTITKAMKIGRSVHNGLKSGDEPAKLVAEKLGGVHYYSGEILKIEEKTWEGFLYTHLTLDRQLELIIKNETMALFEKGSPITVFPDLVCVLDPNDGTALMSSDLREGTVIDLVIAPCHPRLREARDSGEADNAFSPSRFGKPDIVYTPVEKLLPDYF